MTVYYEDKWTTIHHGNALALPVADNTVDLVCTSPPYSDADEGERPCSRCNGRGHTVCTAISRCRLGYVEYDGFRYCFEHYGFAHEYGIHPMRCDLARSGDLT